MFVLPLANFKHTSRSIGPIKFTTTLDQTHRKGLSHFTPLKPPFSSNQYIPYN